MDDFFRHKVLEIGGLSISLPLDAVRLKYFPANNHYFAFSDFESQTMRVLEMSRSEVDHLRHLAGDDFELEDDGAASNAVHFEWDEDDMRALNKCIDDWTDALSEPYGRKLTDCELCELDITRGCGDCSECVIALDTGLRACRGTVYYEYRNARDKRGRLNSARQMIDYLTNLRDRMLEDVS